MCIKDRTGWWCKRMAGKGRGSNYSVTKQETYKRRRRGTEMEYTMTIDQALKVAGLVNLG